VRRGKFPGKGLLALPGGFLNPKETIEDCMLRELREETGLRVPTKVVAGSIKSRRVFDDPHRDARGRVITHAFLIELQPMEGGLPKVTGGDDAIEAFWIPISELQPKLCYADHWDIIRKMTSQA
jgi:bifunctional NMN adenylyltransferase/nudix hydrolase